MIFVQGKLGNRESSDYIRDAFFKEKKIDLLVQVLSEIKVLADGEVSPDFHGGETINEAVQKLCNECIEEISNLEDNVNRMETIIKETDYAR